MPGDSQNKRWYLLTIHGADWAEHVLVHRASAAGAISGSMSGVTAKKKRESVRMVSVRLATREEQEDFDVSEAWRND